MPDTLEEGVEKVFEGNGSRIGFGLLADAIDVKYLDVTHCGLQEVGVEESMRPLAIAFQKNSPLRKKINEAYNSLCGDISSAIQPPKLLKDGQAATKSEQAEMIENHFKNLLMDPDNNDAVQEGAAMCCDSAVTMHVQCMC